MTSLAIGKYLGGLDNNPNPIPGKFMLFEETAACVVASKVAGAKLATNVEVTAVFDENWEEVDQ